MSNLLYPSVHGLGLTLKRTRAFKTLVQDAAAPGYETRVSMGQNPIDSFELSYSVLFGGSASAQSGSQASLNSLSVIEAFFLARQGQFDSFLLDAGVITSDPSRSSVTGQVLTVDANNCAPLVRTLPGSTTNELVYELSRDGSGNVINPVIKNAGTTLVLGTDYNLYSPTQTQTGILDGNGIAYDNWVVKFLSSFGGPITANFGWYYRVRFSQDSQDFDMFHKLLWKAQKVELIGTRV